MRSKSEIPSYWFTPSDKTGADKRSQCATESLFLEERNISQSQMAYFGQCISTKDDPFIQSVNDRVLANSIRIC